MLSATHTNKESLKPPGDLVFADRHWFNCPRTPGHGDITDGCDYRCNDAHLNPEMAVKNHCFKLHFQEGHWKALQASISSSGSQTS